MTRRTKKAEKKGGLKSGSPGPGAEAEKDEEKDKEADNDSEQSGEGVGLGAGDLHLLAHQTLFCLLTLFS